MATDPSNAPLIKIAYATFSSQFDQQQFQHYLLQMPAQTQDAIGRFVKWEDQQRFMMGRLLLKNLLSFTIFIATTSCRNYNTHHMVVPFFRIQLISIFRTPDSMWYALFLNPERSELISN